MQEAVRVWCGWKSKCCGSRWANTVVILFSRIIEGESWGLGGHGKEGFQKDGDDRNCHDSCNVPISG